MKFSKGFWVCAYVECNCKADETRAQELEPERREPSGKDSGEEMQWETV